MFARQPPITAGENLAHHRVIIAGYRIVIFDIEFPVLVFYKTFAAGHNHAADLVGSLQMAVVKYLDTLWRGLKVKGFGNIFQQPALIIAFGDMARQRFARILAGHIYKRLLVAALRAVQGNLAART